MISRLDDYRESMIFIARNGYPFNEYAAREIVSGINSFLSYGLMVNLVLSALRRQDANAVRVFVNDWSNSTRRPHRPVFKWIPGDHFYALEEKFDTLEEAKNYLNVHGYDFESLVERHVYMRDGD